MRIYQVTVPEGGETRVNVRGTAINYSAGPTTILIRFQDLEGDEYEFPMQTGDRFNMPPGRNFKEIRVRKLQSDNVENKIELVAGFGELTQIDSAQVSASSVLGYQTVVNTNDMAALGPPPLDPVRPRVAFFHNPASVAEGSSNMSDGLAVVQITRVYAQTPVGGSGGGLNIARGRDYPISFVGGDLDTAFGAGDGIQPKAFSANLPLDFSTYSRLFTIVANGNVGAGTWRGKNVRYYTGLGASFAEREFEFDPKYPLTLYPDQWLCFWTDEVNRDFTCGVEWNERRL